MRLNAVGDVERNTLVRLGWRWGHVVVSIDELVASAIIGEQQVIVIGELDLYGHGVILPA